jgi:hypothetical protein
VRRAGKAGISATAATAFCSNPGLPVLGEIEENVTCRFIDHTRPDGHLHREALALVSGAIATLAVASSLSRVFRVEAKMQQRVAMNGSRHGDITAAAAVAAARSSMGNVLFPPKREAPVTAVARFYGDSYFVD